MSVFYPFMQPPQSTEDVATTGRAEDNVRESSMKTKDPDEQRNLKRAKVERKRKTKAKVKEPEEDADAVENGYDLIDYY